MIVIKPFTDPSIPSDYFDKNLFHINRFGLQKKASEMWRGFCLNVEEKERLSQSRY